MTHDDLSTARLLCADVLTAAVAADGASAALGTAAAALFTPDVGAGLSEARQWEVGLWEAGPGTDVDTEVDEVFLVLAGAGTVTFADGSAITLRPGVLVHLHDGDRTTWEITERLRKLYLA